MTMTNFLADRYVQALSQCGNASGKIGYAIAKNKRKIETEITEFTEAKNNAIRNCGTEIEPGKIGISTPDELVALNDALKDIGPLTIDVDVMTVPESELADSGLTAGQIDGIWFMVIEEKPKKPEIKLDPDKEETTEIAEVN